MSDIFDWFIHIADFKNAWLNKLKQNNSVKDTEYYVSVTSLGTEKTLMKKSPHSYGTCVVWKLK